MHAVHAAALGVVLALAGHVPAGEAGETPQAPSLAFDIPPLPLDQALLEYSRQSGRPMAATGPLRGAPRSDGIRGTMSADAALRRLLHGSGFDYSLHAGMVRVAPAAGAPSRPARPDPSRPADPRTESGTTDLARINVTARRREELRVDVPISVSLLQGHDLDALGLASASEALRLLPGVTTVDGGNALTQVQIRGVSSSLGGNDNGYYLDEVPFTGVTVPWHPDTRAFDLERIEVLKGPQGALFGEGSMGGTVRILTRAPDPDRVAARIEGGVQQTEGGSSGSLARVMGNLPLVEGRLALRVAATRESLPGWIRNTGGTTAPTNSTAIDTRRLRLRWMSGRWTTDLAHTRSRQDSPGDGYAADDTESRAAPLDTRSQWRSTSLAGHGDFGATRLTLLAAQARLGFDSAGLFAPEVPADLGVGISVDTYEARWSSGNAGAFDWVLGYSRRDADRSDRLDVDGLLARARQRNRANALFADATRTSADGRWSWSGGMRYFHDRVDALTATTERANQLSSTFARLNPRLSLSRHLSPRRKLHASASTGFRSGQLQPAYSMRAALDLGIALPDRIAGDALVSWELGYTHASADGDSLLQGALFHSRWSDLPVRVPLDGVYNGLVNSPGARIDGIELGWTLVPAPALKLDVGGTFVDARYRNGHPGAPSSAGVQVYNVPRTSLFAAATGRWQVGDAMHATASAQASHHTRRRTGLVEGEGGDAITQLGARVGLQSPRGWEAHLYVDNALDDRGAVDGRDLTGNANRLRPRTVGLELHLVY